MKHWLGKLSSTAKALPLNYHLPRRTDHSNEVMRQLAEWKLRSYVAEPERGARKWKGKAAEQAAVYANRRRISGERGKRLQAGRGERVERNFAHQFDTGGLDRLYVRGLGNVHKKLLIQAAACNLALLMRSLFGAGKPKATHDRRGELVSAILSLYSALPALYGPVLGPSVAQESEQTRPCCGHSKNRHLSNRPI